MEEKWVPTDAVFNKYFKIPFHPERPLFSARSMLKLIRWVRFFHREDCWKPIKEPPAKKARSLTDVKENLEICLAATDKTRLCYQRFESDVGHIIGEILGNSPFRTFKDLQNRRALPVAIGHCVLPKLFVPSYAFSSRIEFDVSRLLMRA